MAQRDDALVGQPQGVGARPGPGHAGHAGGGLGGHSGGDACRVPHAHRVPGPRGPGGTAVPATPSATASVLLMGASFRGGETGFPGIPIGWPGFSGESSCYDPAVQISAKADYAVRVMLELAAHGPDLVKSNILIEHQELPRKFVETILVELRRADLVRSHRGADGGYALARPASEITVGAIIRAIDGPLAEVRGLRPHECDYANAAEHLAEVSGRRARLAAQGAGRDDPGPGPVGPAPRARAADGRVARGVAAPLRPRRPGYRRRPGALGTGPAAPAAPSRLRPTGPERRPGAQASQSPPSRQYLWGKWRFGYGRQHDRQEP